MWHICLTSPCIWAVTIETIVSDSRNQQCHDITVYNELISIMQLLMSVWCYTATYSEQKSYPDSQLYILASVHLHAFIQQSDLLKVSPVHHEAANQSWTPVKDKLSPHYELRKNIIINEHHHVNPVRSTSQCLPEKDTLISTKEIKSIILALRLHRLCIATITIKIHFLKHTDWSSC